MFRTINLRCEYLETPLGLDARAPRLSWQLEDTAYPLSAYRIQVFEENSDIPYWDSGRVASQGQLYALYRGAALKPCTRYHWRVRAWDKRGQDSDFSPLSWWETGLMEEPFVGMPISHPDQKGELLTPPQRLRRVFELPSGAERARLYVTALGVYSLFINGQRVSEDLLAPGHTSYNHRLQYQTYDVTGLLVPGKNVAAALLGDGWYRSALSHQKGDYTYGDKTALMAHLEVSCEDGTFTQFVTDGQWTASLDGPVRYADFYMGTHYDARLETPGWDSDPDFDDSAWPGVLVSPQPQQAMLIGQRDQPVRRMLTVPAASVLTTPKGETVLDFGQNLVGWVRFSLRGEAGRTVAIRHAEVLDKDGNFYTENYRSAKAELLYTLKGDPAGETFEPDLVFYGFRYIRLENWPEPVNPADFTAVVIHTALSLTSGFECSDERVNQLFRNIQWGQRGNFVDVPTDCPQRDERLGWTGDCQVFARTALTNMNCEAMLIEWLKDLSCDQREDGAVPFVVPQIFGKDAYGSAAWGDAAVIVPWTLYQVTGDERVLREQYPSMRAWLRYVGGNAPEGVVEGGFHFGDWLGLDAPSGSYVGSTDKSLIATAFYAHTARLTRKAAEVLGYEKDAQELRNLQRFVVRAFRREFITPTGRLAVRTQTAYALTLHFELAEEEHRARMARDLVALIQESDGHLTTGFVGTPYLCLALSEAGYHDVAGQVFLKSDYPGWLYPITKGATTMWEHWDGIKPDGSFWSRDMNSFNHYAYGSIGEWMMRALAGIDMAEPGYRQLLLHPRPIEGLSFVRAWQMTPAGRTRCEWRLEDGQATVTCRVPVGLTAVLVLERADLRQVTESERRLAEVPGVNRAWQSEDDVMLELSAGKFTFKWPIPG